MQAFAPPALRPECSVYLTRCMLDVAWMQPGYSLDLPWMYTGPHASPLPHPWTCFGLIWIIWTLLDAFGHLWTQTSLDSFRNTFTHFCPFWPTYLDPSRPASAKILCHSCFGLPSSNVLNVFLWKISNVDCTLTPLKMTKGPNGFSTNDFLR